MRMLASYDGVQGWKNALDLNEQLKAAAKPVSTAELFGSPLLPEQGVAFPDRTEDDVIKSVGPEAQYAIGTDTFDDIDTEAKEHVQDVFSVDFAKPVRCLTT